MAEKKEEPEVKLFIEHKQPNRISTTPNDDKLVEAVLNNQVNKIQQIIASSTPDLIKRKYQEHGNKMILIIACINQSVSKETLNTLYVSIKSHYYYVDCLDEDWYKWDALHHVARIADPEKLQILIDNVDNLNSLTTFSENALHVLLEYEESVKPFNTLLYNGTESKSCTIISTEKQDTIRCAKILIEAGIDVNHSNFWNETPICIAARYRYREIINLLLKTPYIDLDNYREGGTTIREYLKQNYLQDIPLQSNFLHEDPIKILFNFLKSGDEESFLNFNNENIKDYVNEFDGDNERNSCGNMLQLCFKKGFLHYLHHDLYHETLTNENIMDSPMLTVFCSKGLGRCIEHLLNNGADPKLTYRKFPKTLLEAAAIRGYYPLVAILLQHKASKVTSRNIFEILPKLFENRHILNNHEFYRKHVLFLLLNKLISVKGREILSNEELSILNEVLCHLNLESDDEREDDSQNICQILRLGASLTSKINNHTIIQRLDSDILRLHFDDCIDNNIFCYNSFIEDNDKSYSETRALQFLANDKRKNKLLRHPLLIHFIHNKWLRNFYFFYIDLLFYTTFLLSIYAYIMFRQYDDKFIHFIFYFMLVIHGLKEFIQLIFLYHLKYFLDASNYLEVTVIVSCLTTVIYENEYSMTIAILSSTVVFSMLLGQLPTFAKYTIIFGSTKYFLEYAGFYFMQFASFALVFFIIFPFETQEKNGSTNSTIAPENNSNYDTISGIFKSMFYTLILFTGEFNDRVLEPNKFPVFGRIIMTLFIFCMTIILNNLLVGLIVADMDEMQRDGKLYKQVRTANFISRMNSLIKRLYEFKTNIFIKKIINFLHIFKKGDNKILDLSNCKHTKIFDTEDKQCLKEIRSRTAYDKDILKKLYTFIHKEVNGTHYIQ